MHRFLLLVCMLLVAGCASRAVREVPPAACVPAACPTCPICPSVPPPEKPPEKPMQPATWDQLPDWGQDLQASFDAFLASCRALEKQPLWTATCASARNADRNNLRDWFEAEFQPWQLTNPDGNRDGLITGYYEPVLKGSRQKHKPYLIPAFGVPDDLVVVDLSELYPELKSLRLRGRLQGRKLVPYYSRAEWTRLEAKREPDALLWLDNALEFFFMQVQGSGQIQLDDGDRVRLAYADQNGHPYRSIGKWLIDQGELSADQASMQGIKAWAESHPGRVQELMNANPSMVFFRETAVQGSGPPGALGLPLTPERSIAVDPRSTPLGTPVWLATTYPLSDQPLRRLMLAQDTGGAIRGVVRADFYWGSGSAAGSAAGKMKQKGQMWALMPRGYVPK